VLLKRKPSQNNRSHKPSENPLGKRSAGNLHAAFDEAEAGNVTRREAEFATTEFVVTLGKSIESARQLSTLLTRHDLLKADHLPKELDDENLKKALHVLDVLNFSKEERELYEDHLKWLRIEANTLKKATEKALSEGISIGKQEGISIGEARGIEKGIEKRNLEVAINMLKQKLDDKLISSVTGLNLGEIAKLKNKN
jgi:hypothetical protein